MFSKKSEEQEWSRFRGAMAREREDVAHAEPETPAPPAAITVAPPAPAARQASGDVNVTVPSRTTSRTMDSQDVESLIGEHTTFEGTFKSSGSVRVLGSIQGEIESKNAVYVEERAVVTARVTAGQVTVAGRVDGQIYCPGRVEIRPTGRVTGEIQAGALIVQEGAYFEGSSKMAQADKASEGASR